MKRYIFFGIVLAMAFAGARAQTEFTSGNLIYRTTSGTTVEVAGVVKHNTFVNIPEKVNAFTVTGIGVGAFANDADTTAISAISMPETVTYISARAFYAQNLVFAKLSSNITSIDTTAFMNVSFLGRLKMPAGLKAIGDQAFAGCSGLYDFIDPVPSGLTSIGAGAFMSSSIKEVDLTGYNGSIDEGAFNHCTGLAPIAISESNPYCMSPDGFQVVSKVYKDSILSILPGVRELTVKYPYKNVASLEGTFPNLKFLELPYTWTDQPSITVDSLEVFNYRARSCSDVLTKMKLPNDVDVFVFDYELDNMSQALKSKLTGNDYTVSSFTWPATQLYREEVIPGCEYQKCIDKDNVTYLSGYRNFDGIFESLQKEYPSIFPTTSTMMKWNYFGYTRDDFRNKMLWMYPFPESEMISYAQNGEKTECIDGCVYAGLKPFIMAEYADWFCNGDTYMSARDTVACGRTTLMEYYRTTGDAASLDSYETYVYGAQTSTKPYIEIPLKMTPGISYDISLVMPPHYGIEEYADTLYNLLQGTLSYSPVSAGRFTSKSTSVAVDYTGEVQEIPLFTGMTTHTDWGNAVRITSLAYKSTIAGDRAEANLVYPFYILGVKCVPSSSVVITTPDVNGDAHVDVADVTAVIGVMYKTSTFKYADVNGDGVVDIADVTAVINRMYENEDENEDEDENEN